MDKEILGFAGRYLKKEHYDRFLYSYESGKRARPLLMKRICDRYGKDFGRLLPAASAIEIIHCASLMHDDIIDNEGARRGKKSFHRAFSLNEALLFGDLFATLGLEILIKNNYDDDTKNAFIDAIKDIIEGQLMETGSIDSLKTYISYVEKKTSSLFLLSAKIPFIVYRLDKRVLEFAREYGTAFQIANDLKSGGTERFSILSFISRDEAEGLLKRKLRHLDSLGIIKTKELDF